MQKLIARHIKSINNFLELSNNNNYNELLNIDGIGEIKLNQLEIFLLTVQI